MVREHKEFKCGVEEFLLLKGLVFVLEEPFRYKEFLYREIRFLIPHIQKYTYSVHIYLKGKEYNFHSNSMKFKEAIEEFKKHTNILWE